MREEIDHLPMKYTQLSRCILSLLLGSSLLCGCNEQRPMAVMSEEEYSWQDSAGGITILESAHLGTVDSAPVPAAIDVAQEASVHGLGTIQEIVGGINPLAINQLQSVIRDNRAPEHVCRDTLNILLDIAGSDPDKASAFFEVLLVAVKDKHCRQEALRALGKVSQAAPAWVSVCLPSLRAATRSRDRDVRLSTLKTLGEAEWKQYFGEVGSAPDLPSDIAAILDGPCPFWRDQLVKDTHLLVLIPATVGGVPFTLNLLGELIQHPKNGGHRTKYSYYSERVKAQIGEQSPPRSYWLLMTRDVLPGSRNKGYAAQKELVAGYASREGVPYVLPSVLEAATAIFMHHAREGERLFGNDPWTYTRCQEMVDNNRYPVFVGSFSSGGLFVYNHSYVSNNYGVSCLRKF